MKIKVLTVLSLSAFLFLVACKGSSNSNAANANKLNTNSMVTSNTAATATPPAVDSTATTAVTDAMQKAGYKDVTVSATANEVTLRGTVPKGKLGEAVRIATETGKRKVNNELTEK